MPRNPEDYTERIYRSAMGDRDLHNFRIAVGETDLYVTCDVDIRQSLTSSVMRLRRQLKAYIDTDPIFQTTLRPHFVSAGSPPLVQRMAAAAAEAGVGPMAAVAGAIAEAAGLKHIETCRELLIENGGDIFLFSQRDRKIGVFAGESPFSWKLAVTVKPTGSPVGVCSSAGTVGPSLSFGRADAAVIISDNVALADAVATATANRVRTKSDVHSAVEFALSVSGVRGALVIKGDKLAALGEIELTGI